MASGFTYAAPASSGHSSGGGGAFGFVGNLVHDIGSAARGTPEGLVQLGEHPLRTVENMGKATWQTWSPLFHGHVGEFGHQFYQHPLAPMLDIATVFSGGASLAAATGAKLSDLGLLSQDSALAKIADMPKTLEVRPQEAVDANKIALTKQLPHNPIYNKAYRSIIQAADNHPIIPNWLGTKGLYKRLEFKDQMGAHLALAAQFSAAMKAGEMFAKGGHSDMGLLSHQLSAQAQKDLWANSPEVPVSDILGKYGGKMPKNYAPVKPVADANAVKWFKKAPTNADELANHLRTLGNKFLTKPAEWKKAVYTNADGVPVVRLAHSNAFRRTMADGANSVHFLKALYKYPTAIWKYVQVGGSPRTLVDNTVGNWTMYALRQMGSHGIHGFVEAVRYTKGESAALKMVKEVGHLPEEVLGPKYFRHFKGELGNTYATAMRPDAGISDQGVGNVTGANAAGSSWLSKAYNKSFYPLVHQYADRPVRAAAIAAHLRGEPLVKGLMRQGHSFEDAADTALQHSTQLRDRAIQHARTVAGNYTTLSKTERAIRDIVPFYLWDKHIAMHAANMLRDRPGTVAVGTALGQQGANATRQKLGDIPEWMLGGVPVPLPGSGGRTALLNTQGLNPYSTVPDLTELAQGLITGHTSDKPGDTILGTVNPVLQGLIQQTMGTTATGAPVQTHGGVIPSTLVDIFNSVRPVQLVRQLVGAGKPDTTKSGKPTLYKSDINSIVSAFAGVPIQQADISHALELQKQIENGGKKPKKGKGFTYGG